VETEGMSEKAPQETKAKREESFSLLFGSDLP
jgi:hypothetical protein